MEWGVKLLKYRNTWENYFWGHFLKIIKWDCGKLFPEMGKWLCPAFKDKNVT